MVAAGVVLKDVLGGEVYVGVNLIDVVVCPVVKPDLHDGAVLVDIGVADIGEDHLNRRLGVGAVASCSLMLAVNEVHGPQRVIVPVRALILIRGGADDMFHVHVRVG